MSYSRNPGHITATEPLDSTSYKAVVPIQIGVNCRVCSREIHLFMMNTLLLGVMQLVVSISSLPTGAPGQPFVLDLSGGLAAPGDVIGRVDQSGTIHTSLNVQPDPAPIPPPPAPVDTVYVNQVDPIPIVGPEVFPDAPATFYPPLLVPVDPTPSYIEPPIVPDPNYPPPSNNLPVEPLPSIVPDPNYPPPSNNLPVEPLPSIVPDPNYPPPSNNLPVEPLPSIVPDPNYPPPSIKLPVVTFPPIVPDPNYPTPSNNLPVETVPQIMPIPNYHPIPNNVPVETPPPIVSNPNIPPPSNNVPVATFPDPMPVDPIAPLETRYNPVRTVHTLEPILPPILNNAGIPSGSHNVINSRQTFDHGGLHPPPASNAIDWSCEGYRPHPTNTNMYQVILHRQWTDHNCFGILAWNQTLCSCIVPPDTGVVDPNCPNNRAHAIDNTMYHIKHWGVWLDLPKQCPVHQLWNQTGCRCDWDPLGPGSVVDIPVGGICDLMFNASFTTALRDDANYNSIGRDPWFNVKVENGTARLDNGRMPVWAFASNDFGRDFQVQARIKLDNIPSNTNSHTTIVSNDCDYDLPSVSVSYRPFDQNYRVFFRDQYSNNTLQCNAPSLTPYGYQSVSLEYQSSRLSLKVNGAVCLESNQFGGVMAISRCPFFFGGDGRQQYMTGNMDDVIVRRFCVVAV